MRDKLQILNSFIFLLYYWFLIPLIFLWIAPVLPLQIMDSYDAIPRTSHNNDSKFRPCPLNLPHSWTLGFYRVLLWPLSIRFSFVNSNFFIATGNSQLLARPIKAHIIDIDVVGYLANDLHLISQRIRFFNHNGWYYKLNVEKCKKQEIPSCIDIIFIYLDMGWIIISTRLCKG